MCAYQKILLCCSLKPHTVIFTTHRKNFFSLSLALILRMKKLWVFKFKWVELWYRIVFEFIWLFLWALLCLSIIEKNEQKSTAIKKKLFSRSLSLSILSEKFHVCKGREKSFKLDAIRSNFCNEKFMIFAVMKSSIQVHWMSHFLILLKMIIMDETQPVICYWSIFNQETFGRWFSIKKIPHIFVHLLDHGAKRKANL